MENPTKKSSVAADHYILGYDWGIVEAFVQQDTITVHCLPRHPPGMLYEARISRPDGKMYMERSYIPDPSRPRFLAPKDCDDPAQLRPNIEGMLDSSKAPAEVKEVIRKAYTHMKK